jgi:hypothetical protein
MEPYALRTTLCRRVLLLAPKVCDDGSGPRFLFKPHRSSQLGPLPGVSGGLECRWAQIVRSGNGPLILDQRTTPLREFVLWRRRILLLRYLIPRMGAFVFAGLLRVIWHMRSIPCNRETKINIGCTDYAAMRA